MRVLFLWAILSGLALAQRSALTEPMPDGADLEHASVGATDALNSLPALPPLPRGNSTVVGGIVKSVDPVRDQLTIGVYGGRPMKVLFDERTQVYRDGQPTSLADLRGGERISVETMLDGSTVFARSIRMLSHSVEGECHGQIVSFDRNKGEMLVRDIISPQPIKVRVDSATIITREGQQASASADLKVGALVSIKFQPGASGVVARQISLLANVGSPFVFTGEVTFLDLHSGLLVVVDPRDNKQYEIAFDPAVLPVSRELHEGAEVEVKAAFDGARYTANAISINAPGPGNGR